VLSRASVAPNVRLAASGEGEGGSSCFFLTCILREEDMAVRPHERVYSSGSRSQWPENFSKRCVCVFLAL